MMETGADLGASLLSSSQQHHQDFSLVKLANSILSQLHINQKLSSFQQINGSLFVTMYESLCGEILPDVIRVPQSMEDDVHNAQSVVDAIALDVLHTSLSHISGEAVAKGDRNAIGNLLDLFSSLVEFILNKIESDLSDEEEVDRDRVTSELIEDILSRDLRDVSLDKENYESGNSDQDEHGVMNREDLERVKNSNSTLELIKESEELERRLNDDERRRKLEIELRLEEERIIFEEEKSRRRILEDDRIREEKIRRLEEKRLVDAALARYGERPLAALDLSDDASSEGAYVSDAIPLFESTANHDSSRIETPSDFRTPSKGHHSSLLSLAEETSELSRSAVRNSPARQRAERSAFLEAAIKSALKKIDREAKGVEQLVTDIPRKKHVRLKLSEEFGVDVPSSKSPTRSPYRPRPLSENNNADDGIPRPSITISSPKSAPKSPAKRKKSATVKPFHTKATVPEKTDKLKRLYAFDYTSILEEQRRLDGKDKRRADNMERNMRAHLTQSSRKARPPVQERKNFRNRQKSASLSPPRKGLQDYVPKDSDLYYLLDAFPNLYMSSDTLHDLWRQSMKQLESLKKIEQETKRKDVLHKQLEDAARRQNLVSEIFRKDLDHRRRLTEIKNRQAQKKAVKFSLQEKRTQSARIRRYYQDFHLGMRAKMLNKRIKDELIFKKVFKDGLTIQRQCISDMRKYAKEQRQKKSVQQQNEIESLENFYRDQFMMLADATQKERLDLATRQKAQSRVINRMKSELRHKMETEVRKIQSEIVEDDDGHFRQVDADTLHQDLLLSKYKTYT